MNLALPTVCEQSRPQRVNSDGRTTRYLDQTLKICAALPTRLVSLGTYPSRREEPHACASSSHQTRSPDRWTPCARPMRSHEAGLRSARPTSSSPHRWLTAASGPSTSSPAPSPAPPSTTSRGAPDRTAAPSPDAGSRCPTARPSSTSPRSWDCRSWPHPTRSVPRPAASARSSRPRSTPEPPPSSSRSAAPRPPTAVRVPSPRSACTFSTRAANRSRTAAVRCPASCSRT